MELLAIRLPILLTDFLRARAGAMGVGDGGQVVSFTAHTGGDALYGLYYSYYYSYLQFTG